MLVFTWTGQLGFDLPKALWSRALEWPIAALLALALYRHGRAVIPRTRLHLFVAAFVVANILSTVTAENTYIAVFGERNRYLGLTNVVDLAVFYIALVVAFRSLRDWAILAAGIGVSALGAVAYGLVQYTGNDPIGWGVDSHARAFGTIGNPDMYGHFLVTIVAACIGLGIVSRQRAVRIAAIAVGLPSLAVLAVIGTRGSLVALAVTLAVAAVLVIATHGRAFLRSRVAIGGAVAGAVVLAGLLATPTGQRLLSAAPTADRIVEWNGTFRTFLARPILGWGTDNLAPGFQAVRPERMEDAFPAGGMVIDQAHNWVLQAFATTGLVGGIALVAMLAAFSLTLYRQRRGPFAVLVWPLVLAGLAYWANGLTSPDSVSIAWLPWVSFAMTAWLVSRAPVTVPAIRPLPSPAIAAALGLALAVAGTGWNAYRANAEILRAVFAYPRDAGETVLGAHAAISLDPGRADYWNFRGLGLQLRGQYAVAAADFTEATRRVPYQPAYWINVARARMFQVQNGDFSGGGQAASLAAARHAVDTDPRISATHKNYAEIALAFGDAPTAVSEARIAFDLQREDRAIDTVLANACIAHPDREYARRVLEAAVALKSTSEILRAALAQVTGR